MQPTCMALMVGGAALVGAEVARADTVTLTCRHMESNAPGNLIQNGSFESGANPGGYLTLNPGSSAIKNWAVIRGGIDYYGTGWSSSNGRRSLDLNGTPGVGGVAQTFATIPGRKYCVSFDMAGHPSGLLQTMRVGAAGQSYDFTFRSGADQNHLGWQRRAWEFTANAPSTTLEFYSLQKGYEYGGPALDNVYVAGTSEILTSSRARGESRSASDMRGVDFLNFTYQPALCSAEEGVGKSVRVRMGEWNGKESYYHVSKVIYGDLTGDGRDDAVVVISCGPKGANFTQSEIHIYSAHGQQASLIATLDDSDLEREYKRHNSRCSESSDSQDCILWSGIRDIRIAEGKLIIESLAEGSHASAQSVVKFEYRIEGGRLTPARTPQKPTPSEETSYFDDFSSYKSGSPPTGWLLRGADEVTPNITYFGGIGPSYRLLEFPEVPWQFWDRWVLKEGVIPGAPYTVTVKLNFRNMVADRAGLTIAWNDANWNRVDIQPNVYWHRIECRVTYTGPVDSNVVVNDVGDIPLVAFQDYWLRVVVKDDRPGQGRLSVFLSSDGAHFRRVIDATGLQDLTGLVGVGTAGPHLPHVYFDDFSVISGAVSEETVFESIAGTVAMMKSNLEKRVATVSSNLEQRITGAWRTHVIVVLLCVAIALVLVFIWLVWWMIKHEREKRQLMKELVAVMQERAQGSEETDAKTNAAEESK